MKQHVPVLLNEVIEYLNPKPNEDFIDCTVGLGGHAQAILNKTRPKGRLLGIDQDRESLQQAQKNLHKFQDRTIFVNDNFNNLENLAKNKGFAKVEGILFDLGLSSWHFTQSKRGFSFEKNEPLDMRLASHKSEKKTAEYVVNNYSFQELADVLYKYGDIRKSKMFAQRIIDERKNKKIFTTSDLKRAVGVENPKVLAPIFQAIRIEVNKELENLLSGLNQAVNLLKPNAKVVVISFHSGEDRIAKNFFREQKNVGKIKILTKKPIVASKEEVKINPKSRSAKLRAGEKI